jgi:hypothetical protein
MAWNKLSPAEDSSQKSRVKKMLIVISMLPVLSTSILFL